MENPKYLVNIYYKPLEVTGQELQSIGGVTYSMPVYTGNYFIATMPEVLISATGTSYDSALSNLLIIATSSTTSGPGQLPLSFS